MPTRWRTHRLTPGGARLTGGEAGDITYWSLDLPGRTYAAVKPDGTWELFDRTRTSAFGAATAVASGTAPDVPAAKRAAVRYGVMWCDSTPSIVPFEDGIDGPFTLAQAKRVAVAGLQESIDYLRYVQTTLRALRETDVFPTEALFEVTA